MRSPVLGLIRPALAFLFPRLVVRDKVEVRRGPKLGYAERAETVLWVRGKRHVRDLPGSGAAALKLVPL